ncbi:cobalt ABC transporter ATPase [Thermincola ferriacetica]|uniref:ABC transporter ATP-binding protein n=1 Tax=Thermincola ferriacetica TaxID=281456 RepID=A0A0L6W1X2_9FIRM|nr:energy-coupling factor transporter ATPase [Thermincola ferriacetica]KNZ69451.1 cobalt ABC transporter ATPase [Thermincola ferriacetica]
MVTLVEMAGVEFTYPDDNHRAARPVLKGVNLRVGRGEFLAVIGPNGSGKSTLVKHFNGILLPSKGRVTVDGLDTANQDNLLEIRRKVGLLFQNPENQLVSSIVEEDVAFGPENLALPPVEIQKRVAEALEAVEMTPYRHQTVHTLSGGQKQRVAIAGLLAMRPDCLVLDEPSSMLDPAGRRRLFDILLRLHKRGMTIILVTHLMEEAALADRVCIFGNGTILREGTPEEIFSEPDFLISQNLEVPQINCLAAMLRNEGFNIPASILTVDEMVDYLCTLKHAT